jgi:hypothetical protein
VVNSHADPSITYSVYAHLIDRASHVAEARAAIELQEAEDGKDVEGSDGQEGQSTGGLKAV